MIHLITEGKDEVEATWLPPNDAKGEDVNFSVMHYSCKNVSNKASRNK